MGHASADVTIECFVIGDCGQFPQDVEELVGLLLNGNILGAGVQLVAGCPLGENDMPPGHEHSALGSA